MLFEVKAEAEEDLVRIYAFNEERSTDWARKVEQRLVARARMLPTSPNVGRHITDAGVRRVSVPDVHYVIDYEVRDNCLIVLRFLSTRDIR